MRGTGTLVAEERTGPSGNRRTISNIPDIFLACWRPLYVLYRTWFRYTRLYFHSYEGADQEGTQTRFMARGCLQTPCPLQSPADSPRPHAYLWRGHAHF